MDSISLMKTTQASPVAVKNQRRGAQALTASVRFSNSSKRSLPQSLNSLNICGRRRSRALIVAVANADPRGFKYRGVGTPHEPTSPEGMFLSAILQNHRSLFSFAVSEQLDELASKRDEAAAQERLQNHGSMESILHKRIAEIKEKERQNGVEDVIYMSIVHKFSKVGVPMVQKLSESITDNRLEIWPSKCIELESIHSPEIQELIKEHVTRVLRMRGKSFLVDGSTTTTIDRLDLGRTYAASVLYGYFLKSASFRRQMDKSLVRIQEDLQSQQNNISSVADSYLNRLQSRITQGQSTNTQLLELCHESQTCDTGADNLRSYVLGFDSETLQRCAKIKSQEAVNVIEKHAWALFGDDKMGEADSGNEIVVTFPSLERLVLEAAAFGTFLWDVERSVDATYTLQKN